MNRQGFSLLLRLCVIYCVALLIGTATLTLINNMLINGISLQVLLKFNLKAIFAGDVLILILLILISMFRLRRVMSYWEGAQDESSATNALRSLYRFPAELFWGMTGLCFIFSMLYHLTDLLYHGLSPAQLSIRAWADIGESLLKEMALALTIAMLFFILSRSSLRLYIIQIQEASAVYQENSQQKHGRSFIHPFMITFVVCFFLTIFSMLNYVYTKTALDQKPLLQELALIAGYYMTMGGCLFGLQAMDFRRELRTIIASYQALLGSSPNTLFKHLPVLSEDELGRLAYSVNRFRSQMITEYNNLEQELQLASKVQRKLMPQAYYAAGAFEICADCQQSQEVGGDLYDIVAMEEHKIAVINGDVSGKGLPAALVMSAVMVLFRAETKKGGSASEIVTRLNRIMTETLKGDMYITLGLAIIDTVSNQVEYASAGHMAPYMVHAGQAVQLDCSSLPIGIDEEEVYRHEVLSLAPGQRLVLYTDGIVEAMDSQGEMFGFERLESVLEQLSEGKPLERQLHDLTDLLPNPTGTHADDWTIVMIARKEADTGAFVRVL
jgi:sigma-B regulation protein RsbU (phosphoserine phosphatase)